MTTDTTPGGLPFPLGDDAVMLGAQRIEELAEAIDPRLTYAHALGATSVSLDNAAGATVTVTFPAGRFTRAPYPLLTRAGAGGGAAKLIPYYQANTTTSFVVGLYSGDGSVATAAVTVVWYALQLHATSTPGRAAARDSRITVITAPVVCHTEGCENQGITLDVTTGWTDEDGTHTVGGIVCGVCSADLHPEEA